MIHTVKGFSVVNEAEVDVFSGILLLSPWSNECCQFDLSSLCFFQTLLPELPNMWKFWVCILLKPSLKDFEHNRASIWNEHCRSPTPAARDSTWRGERCRWMRHPLIFLGLPTYFKFKILFYTFTETLGQRFDIFSSPSPRFIISINHCCSSEFLLQWLSQNQPYHLLSTSSNVSYS